MDNLRCAILMVLAMLGFAIEDMFIKLMADRVGIGQILTMLGLGGGLIYGMIVRAQGDRLVDHNMRCLPIFLRAMGEVIGVLGFVSAIVLTPISSASAILQATPLVVTLGAALFLGEAVGWRRWSAILVGLFGVILIIRPGLDAFEPLSLLALLGVLGLAIRDLATRRVPATLTSMQLCFLGISVTIPAGLGYMLVAGERFIWLSPQDWIYMTAAISIGFFAYFAIVAAMRGGDVSFVSPFRYARMLFALVIGVVVFSETPDAMTLLGAAIIVASGIYTVWRERKVRLSTRP